MSVDTLQGHKRRIKIDFQSDTLSYVELLELARFCKRIAKK